MTTTTTTRSFFSEEQQKILSRTAVYCCDGNNDVARVKLNKCMRRTQNVSAFTSNLCSFFVFSLLFVFQVGNIPYAHAAVSDGSIILTVTTTTTTVDYLTNRTTVNVTLNDISNPSPVEISTSGYTIPGLAFPRDDPRFEHSETVLGTVQQNIQIDTVVKRGEDVILEFSDFSHSTASPSTFPTVIPTNVPIATPTVFPTESPSAAPTLELTSSVAPSLLPVSKETNSQIFAEANQQESERKKNPNLAAIIGGTVGGVVLLLFVVAAVIVMKKRNESFDYDDDDDIEQSRVGASRSFPPSFHSYPSPSKNTRDDSTLDTVYLGGDEESGRGGVNLKNWKDGNSSLSILHDQVNSFEGFEVEQPW